MLVDVSPVTAKNDEVDVQSGTDILQSCFHAKQLKHTQIDRSKAHALHTKIFSRVE